MSKYTDSSSAQIAVTTVHSILIVLNIAGNSLVCVVIIKNQDMRYVGNCWESDWLTKLTFVIGTTFIQFGTSSSRFSPVLLHFSTYYCTVQNSQISTSYTSASSSR